MCNGRNKRRCHCSMPFRREYSAARAQGLADARRGVSRSEEELRRIMAAVRADLARGLTDTGDRAAGAGGDARTRRRAEADEIDSCPCVNRDAGAADPGDVSTPCVKWPKKAT